MEVVEEEDGTPLPGGMLLPAARCGLEAFEGGHAAPDLRLGRSGPE